MNMAKDIDAQWLESFLNEDDAGNHYIPDDGFSVGVMQAIASEQMARYQNWRKVVLVISAMLAAIAIFYGASSFSVTDFIQQLFARFDFVVLLPASALLALAMSAGFTMLLRE